MSAVSAAYKLLPICCIPLPPPPGNIHLLLRMDFSFPSPSLIGAALLPKLFPLESMKFPLIDSEF
jgi:hypothetical protein